jgi:hypothetical protein
MSRPAEIQRALERLEARRVLLEREIVNDLDRRFFATPTPAVREIVASHDASDEPGGVLGEPGTATANGSHITVTWFEEA